MDKKKKTPLDPAAVEQTCKWVITGASAADVADSIRQHFPSADPPVLMLAAMEKFREAAAFEPSILLGFVLEGAKEIYRRCLETGDNATALRALKSLEGMAKNVRRQEGAGREPIIYHAQAADEEEAVAG